MDNITKPEHYTYGKYECIDVIHELTKNLAGVQAFALGNTIKYLWRFQHKNGVEDLKKAEWYLNRLISEFGDEQSEVEQPKIEQSEVEQPKIEQSEVEQPKIEQSEVEQPKIEQSEVEQTEQSKESKNAQNIKKLINEYKYLPDETNWEAFKNNKLK